MELLVPTSFDDYELVDTGGGFRLDRWGSVVLQRPDPQIIWQRHQPPQLWDAAQAVYLVAGKDVKKGWSMRKPFAHPWTIRWRDVLLKADLANFKHTGIFAEQAANWEWMTQNVKLKNQKSKFTILNLFAYTGAATMALTRAGCFVTHVDASKPAIAWAKENQQLNRLAPDSIRWMLDDVMKFVRREVNRGQRYDGIIMDPPAFGHGPRGNVWKFNEHLPRLLSDCVKLLSPQARFLLINGYATNSSALALKNLLEDAIAQKPGKVSGGELCLKQKDGRLISTGIFARWTAAL